MSEKENQARTLYLPEYSETRELLRMFPGVPKAAVKDMIYTIYDQRGTPQSNVDWSEPDKWIGERLSGSAAELAMHIWLTSERRVNPRRIYGSYQFINTHHLLDPDSGGVYRLTNRGQAFLDGDPATVRQIDEEEGIPQLLSIIATKTRAKRGDLLPGWIAFLHAHSKIESEAAAKSGLRYRLLNLIDRHLVEREGSATYVITQEGVKYASSPGPVIGPKPVETDPKTEVIQSVNSFNEKQRNALKQRLAKMDPYRFEQLIGDLLESMGYDVQVTKPTGDKGVDVVAKVQFGITTITEVVQVKRHQSSIHRPTLDQLRGSLPYYNALRGTIITTGTFTEGCKEVSLYPGAAPIGLIDGEKLLDLLFEHELGVTKGSVTLYELDEAFFTEPAEMSLDGQPLEGIEDMV